MSTEKSCNAPDLDRVCIELDELVIKYFETFSDLCDLKRQLEDTMKDGYLNMAKARYSMGARSVGSLQYGVKEGHLALVNVDVTSLNGQFVPQFTSSSTPTYSGEKPLDNDSEKSLRASSDTGEDSDLSSAVSHLSIGLGVRKRNVPGKSSENGGPMTSTTVLGDGGGRDHATIQDPIKWFGILAPKSLKQTQQAFRSGIELVCRVASLQSHLLSIRESYMKLLQEKKRYEAESSDVAPPVEN